MSHDVDVIVVGAGAAGLAAARTARSLGLSARVLEAQDRIGGRAHTAEIVPGAPWDSGAYWLQDVERNFYVRYAAEIGFALDTAPRHAFMWERNDWASAETLRIRDDYYAEAFAAIDRAGNMGLDVAASEVVPPHPRFQAMFASWYTALNGAEPELSSTLDESRFRDDGSVRVRPGYGALVAAYGHGLPVALSTPVERIRWDGPEVGVETARGTLRCRAVIVTASTTALARGALRFHPALPPDVAQAFDDVPLGTAEKVAFAFERDIFGLPENSQVSFQHDTAEAIRFHIKLGGHPTAIGYLAGSFAAGLAAEGAEAMIDFAEEKLVEVFGPVVRSARVKAVPSRWRNDPWIGGGYSVARPGKADQRRVLARAIGERIFFAGEACSITAFGTVHGAHEAGIAAARAVCDTLRVPQGAR